MHRFHRFLKNCVYLALVMVFAFSTLALSQSAQADPKPFIWDWWPSHWENLDFNPYMEGAPHAHTSQWDHSNWMPEHWVEQANGDGLLAVGKLYKAGVIKDQYVDDGVPVLVVGDAFYYLGGYDKQRVMQLIDHVYGITTNQMHNGIFKICDSRTDDEIGVYTKYGAHFL